MVQNDPTQYDPWVPGNGVQSTARAPGLFAKVAARLSQRPTLSWLLPLMAIALYTFCSSFFDPISVLVWGRRQGPAPDHGQFMAGVTTVSGALWALGAGMQILLIAARHKLPGVYWHLLPALALSAYCAVGFLSTFDRTSTVIENYSTGNDDRDGGRVPRRSPPPLPNPAR